MAVKHVKVWFLATAAAAVLSAGCGDLERDNVQTPAPPGQPVKVSPPPVPSPEIRAIERRRNNLIWQIENEEKRMERALSGVTSGSLTGTRPRSLSLGALNTIEESKNRIVRWQDELAEIEAKMNSSETPQP